MGRDRNVIPRTIPGATPFGQFRLPGVSSYMIRLYLCVDSVMNQPVQIRTADPSDAGQIMAVINSAFRVAEEFFCFEDRITLEEVERLFTTGTFLLAEARTRGDRVLAGCVYVELK